jgi:hypothetical protein
MGGIVRRVLREPDVAGQPRYDRVVPSPVVLLSVLVGFGLIIVAGTWLGAGSHLALEGLFPAQGRSDWPRGVQEGDVPHFAVDHLDSPSHPAPADIPPIAVGPVVVHVGFLDPHH